MQITRFKSAVEPLLCISYSAVSLFFPLQKSGLWYNCLPFLRFFFFFEIKWLFKVVGATELNCLRNSHFCPWPGEEKKKSYNAVVNTANPELWGSRGRCGWEDVKMATGLGKHQAHIQYELMQSIECSDLFHWCLTLKDFNLLVMCGAAAASLGVPAWW